MCEVGRVFPRHVQRTCLTGESPLSRPRVAHTLQLYNYLLRFHLTKRWAFLFYIGLLLPSRRVYSYIKRAKRPLVFFNSKVLIELRASNSTSKAIFYTIIK